MIGNKMSSIKEKFDMIISLGGNCAAGTQMVTRGLRTYSLPFDWTFMADSRPVEYFPEGLRDKFKNLCLKENLEELKGSERGDERFQYQYKDNYTGYRFIHLFHKDINNEGVYEKSYETLRRRVDRLYEKLATAKKVMIVLQTNFVVDEKYIYEIKKTFEELYPDIDFEYRIVMLEADRYEEKQDGNLYITYSKRGINMYDFGATNWEWNFLDDIGINAKIPKSNIKLSFKLFKKRFTFELSWKKA